MNWFNNLIEALNKTDATEEQKQEFKSLLNKVDLNTVFMPLVDRAVSQGVETNKKRMQEEEFPKYFSEKFENEYNARLKKDFPELNPTTEQKRIAELENTIKLMQEETEKKEKALKRQSLESKLRDEYKVPSYINISAFLNSDDEADIREHVESLMKSYNDDLQKIREETEQEVAKKYNYTNSHNTNNSNNTSTTQDGSYINHNDALQQLANNLK